MGDDLKESFSSLFVVCIHVAERVDADQGGIVVVIKCGWFQRAVGRDELARYGYSVFVIGTGVGLSVKREGRTPPRC